MGDLTAVSSLIYGDLTLDLEKYEVDEQPIVSDKLGRTGTAVKVTATCIVEAAAPGDFETALTAAYTSLAADGQLLTLTGLGGITEYTMAPSSFSEGGPHVEIKVVQGNAPLLKSLELTITGKRLATEDNSKQGGGGGNVPQPRNSYKVKTTTDPAGLETVTWSGEMTAIGSGAFFIESILPQFQGIYQQPQYVVDYDYESSSDTNQTRTTYRMTARGLVGELPNAGKTLAVDGEASQHVERDENYRLTTTTDYDLEFTGDGVALHNSLRPVAASGQPPIVILRESMVLNTIAKPRLKSSFTVLTSADVSALMDFQQTLRYLRNDPVFEERQYAGADPVIVQKPARITRITQSGSAKAQGRFFTAPAPVMPMLLEPPEVTYQHLNPVEKATTWSYTMVPTDQSNNPEDVINVLQMLTAMQRNAQDTTFMPAAKAPAFTS